MKRIFEVVGFLLTLWGVAGLVHEWFGWFKLWGVVAKLGWFEGYEVYASIVLAVAGLALMVASERVGRGGGGGAAVTVTRKTSPDAGNAWPGKKGAPDLRKAWPGEQGAPDLRKASPDGPKQ